MAIMTLLFKVQPTRIGAVVLDASLSEVHRFDTEVTKHPVERGAKISDHLRPEPDRVTIEGLVSNTPITRGQQARAVEFSGDGFRGEVQTTAAAPSLFGVPGNAEEAFAKLLDMRAKGELFTIVTQLKTYESMAMTSLEVPRDRTTGDALRFTANFEQVLVVENKRTQLAPATDPRANKKVKAGRQAGKKVKQPDKLERKYMNPWVGQLEDLPVEERDFLEYKFRLMQGGG